MYNVLKLYKLLASRIDEGKLLQSVAPKYEKLLG